MPISGAESSQHSKQQQLPCFVEVERERWPSVVVWSSNDPYPRFKVKRGHAANIVGFLRRKRNGSRPTERARKPREDGQVGVKPHMLNAAHTQRCESVAVLQVTKRRAQQRRVHRRGRGTAECGAGTRKQRPPRTNGRRLGTSEATITSDPPCQDSGQTPPRRRGLLERRQGLVLRRSAARFVHSRSVDDACRGSRLVGRKQAPALSCVRASSAAGPGSRRPGTPSCGS